MPPPARAVHLAWPERRRERHHGGDDIRLIHLWGAPLALAAATIAGASLPILAIGALLWALAAIVPRVTLLLLAAAPLALALGIDLPQDVRDMLATVATVLFSLAPLVLHLGGAPTWRQSAIATAIATTTFAASLTPWGRTLADSDLAPGALTLAIIAATLVVFAIALRTPQKTPH